MTANYILKNGVLEAGLYFDGFNPAPVLRQRGGQINGKVTVQRGTYYLENGVCHGVTVPTGDGYSLYSGGGTVIQTGGTNLGSIAVGGAGRGTYILSNGVSYASGITLGASGGFTQYGGTQVVSSVLSMTGRSIARETWAWGGYLLHGGSLTVGGMSVDGFYSQKGGSNYVSGDINLYSRLVYGWNLNLEGGFLTENNLTAERAILQTGGLHTIKSNLTVYGGGPTEIPWFGAHYSLSGGKLVVSNINLRGAIMSVNDGTLSQSGTVTLGGGRLWPGTGSHQFGALQLEKWNSWTNSSIFMPTNRDCILRFRPGNHLNWATNATLFIENWRGSLSGKGVQQVIFGSNSTTLTRKQLNQVGFLNPLQLKGVFPAMLLPTGEPVPALVLQGRRSGGQLLLEWSNGYVLQTAPEPLGPWRDVPTSTNGFAVDFSAPQQFFRLRE